MKISSASWWFLASFCPVKLALVTAKGPVVLSSSIANLLSGTLIPIVFGDLVPTPSTNFSLVSTTTVKGPGQYRSTTSGMSVIIFSLLTESYEGTNNETGLLSSLSLILNRIH